MRRVLSALTVAAVAGVGLLVPGTAYAAAPPTGIWASSVEGDLGTLQVGVQSEAGVASVEAHIIRYDNGAEVALATNFVLHDGTENNGFWRTAAPLQLAELANYRVDVQVTDRDGVTAFQHYAGIFIYVVETFIEDFSVTDTVTYSRREAVVKGRLMGRWPGTRVVAAVPNFPMEALGSIGWFPASFSTKADGTFRGSVTIAGQNETVSVSTAWGADPDYTAAYAEEMVTINPAPGRVEVVIDHTKVIAGESVHISGQVLWRSPDGWVPFTGSASYAGVLLCREAACDNISWSEYPALDQEGRFELTFVPYQTSYLKVAHFSEDPFIAHASSAAKKITVTQRAEFTDFWATREDPQTVRLTGHLAFLSGWTPAVMPIKLQFSKTGNGNWRTVKTVDIGHNPTNPEGYFFTELVEHAGPGYWRVSYNGGELFQDDVTDAIFVS